MFTNTESYSIFVDVHARHSWEMLKKRPSSYRYFIPVWQIYQSRARIHKPAQATRFYLPWGSTQGNWTQSLLDTWLKVHATGVAGAGGHERRGGGRITSRKAPPPTRGAAPGDLAAMSLVSNNDTGIFADPSAIFITRIQLSDIARLGMGQNRNETVIGSFSRLNLTDATGCNQKLL